MNRLVCAVRGHRWISPTAAHETAPTIECTRCGKRRSLAAKLVDPSWVGRNRRGRGL